MFNNLLNKIKPPYK